MIGFRVDANENIASGHLVRCMTIAQECLEKGLQCMFFLADHKSVGMLQERGLDYVVLDVLWNDWDSGLEKMQQVVHQYAVTKLVVDSYLVTAHYLERMNQVVPVIYIDDFCKQQYKITGVIHYTQWNDEDTIQKLYCDTDVEVLAGMRYLPLRQEFREVLKETTRKPQVMITTGGTDPYHISLKVAQLLLQQDSWKEYKVLVVLGCMNQEEEVFRQLAGEYPNLKVKKNVNNMAQLMRESTMVLSAGGTTMCEVCACRTPLVCFAFSDDQVEFCRKFQERGVALYSGDARTDQKVPENIVNNLTTLLKNTQMRETSRKKMAEMLDTNGVQRIVEELLVV